MATANQPQQPDDGYVDPHWSRRSWPAWFPPLLIGIALLVLVAGIVAIAVS